jgi:hypothetical protein
VLRTEGDLKNQIDSARDVVGLGLILVLICLFTYVLLGVQSWVLLGVSLLGAISIIEGFRRYFNGKRGLRK